MLDAANYRFVNTMPEPLAELVLIAYGQSPTEFVEQAESLALDHGHSIEEALEAGLMIAFTALAGGGDDEEVEEGYDW